MSNTLTARLLAEIERREGINGPHGNYGHGPFVDEMAGYLDALRKIMEIHRRNPLVDLPDGDPNRDYYNCADECDECLADYPCSTVRAIATALDVTP